MLCCEPDEPDTPFATEARDVEVAGPAKEPNAEATAPSPAETSAASPPETSASLLPRADRLLLAQFRRQLAHGLMFSARSRRVPADAATAPPVAPKATVLYTTTSFDGLWWFENVLLGRKRVVAFGDIVSLSAAAPTEEDANTTGLAAWLRDGTTLELRASSPQQRDRVLRALRLCAAIATVAKAEPLTRAAVEKSCLLFGLAVAADDDGASPAHAPLDAAHRAAVLPGSAGEGRVHSPVSHFTAHHARLYDEGQHPERHHHYALAPGTVVEVAFSDDFTIAIPAPDAAAELAKEADAQLAAMSKRASMHPQAVASRRGGAAGSEAADGAAALAEAAAARGCVIGGAGEGSAGFFAPGMFVIGEVVAYDALGDHYTVAFRRGPFDADALRDALWVYEAAPRGDGANARRFAAGTHFLRVPRHDLLVEYTEQRARRRPLFLLLASAAQVAYGLWHATSHGDGTVEAAAPVMGASVLWYRVVGDWPSCEDLRPQAWRLLSYQLVHNGYTHLGGNMMTQLVFGLPVEWVHGPLRVGAIYNLGVVVGALTCSLFDPYSQVVGASGGVYCVYGVHVANLLLNWSEMRKGLFDFRLRLLLLAAFNAYEIANATVYATEGYSYAAHIGGWLAGVLAGLLLLRDAEEHRFQRAVRAVAFLSFGAYCVLCAVHFASTFPPQFVTRRVTIEGVDEVPCCWTALWCHADHPDEFSRADFDLFSCRAASSGGLATFRAASSGEKFETCPELRAHVALAANATAR